MADDQIEVAKIEVKFKTHLAQYKVTEKPFQVPINLNRRGLSQVINHLLARETHAPFDFLIQNEFLRTTLEKYMQTHGRSSEETITIEYVELLDAPTPSNAATHSDWISALDNRSLALQAALREGSGRNPKFVLPFGGYDANLCVYDSSRAEQGKSALMIGIHEQPILGVSSYFRGGQTFDLASCSQDSTVYVWKVDLQKEKSSLTHRLEGHEGAVEEVEFDPTGRLLATCSWDDTVKIWSLADAVDAEETGAQKLAGNKKKKTKDGSTPATNNSNPDGSTVVQARSTLTEHMQCVSVVQWTSPEQLVSGSWDHSLRFWDVESGVCTSHFDGNKVILALDYSQLSHTVVTGHADKSVRVWDPRVSIEHNSLSTAYVSHTGWVTAIKWHPTNPNLLISGSYDTNIKVWDIRASTPLHSMPAQHKDKVTCLAWLDTENFASGGADKFIRTYNFPTAPGNTE